MSTQEDRTEFVSVEDYERRRREATLEAQSATPSPAWISVELVEALVDLVPEPPERNCSCHISPPCGDCVEWSLSRDVLERVRFALKGVR